jgi:hypothetical protein
MPGRWFYLAVMLENTTDSYGNDHETYQKYD